MNSVGLEIPGSRLMISLPTRYHNDSCEAKSRIRHVSNTSSERSLYSLLDGARLAPRNANCESMKNSPRLIATTMNPDIKSPS